MTTGKPWRVLISFAFPMLLSVVFQQLYSLADSVIAGKFTGEQALAAIGASNPIVAVFMAFAFGINMGCSVVTSQLFGAGRMGDVRTTVTTSYILASVISVILTVSGMLLCKPVLVSLGTPDEILKDSCTYLYVYILGLFFLFLYNISSGLFSAMGDSKTPLYFLIASSLSNIVLDILFVAVFHWGVAGVAWATFIAQGLSGIAAAVTLIRRTAKLECSKKPQLFSFGRLSRVLSMSLPCILQQLFISVGNVFVQNLINSHGADVIAGFSAGMKINIVVLSAFSAMSNSLSSFTGQNLGAGKPERVKKGFLGAVCFSMIICTVLSTVLFFGGKYVMLLFVNSSATATIAAGAQFLSVLAPIYVFAVIKLQCDAVLKGAGSMAAFTFVTFIDLGLRVMFAYILHPHFGVMGIWLSWPVGWAIGAVCSLVFYLSGLWKHKWVRENAI